MLFITLIIVLLAGVGTLASLIMGVALHTFVFSLFPAWSFNHYLVLFSLLLSLPIASYVAVLVTEDLLHGQIAGRPVAMLVLCFTWVFLFSTGYILDLIEAALLVLNSTSALSLISLFMGTCSAVIFVAGLVAFVLSLGVMLFELPLRWLVASNSGRQLVSAAAFRPLLMLLILSFGLNLLIGFVQHELWPATILKQVLP